MIYYIQDLVSGHIKIGHAECAWRRFSKIQSDTPGIVKLLATEEGGVDKEAERHATFAQSRIRGEWFSPADNLLAHIATLATPVKERKGASSCRFWNGMSDAQVSAASGVSESMLVMIRAGTRRPSPGAAIKLQRATGVSAVKLVFGDLAEEAA